MIKALQLNYYLRKSVVDRIPKIIQFKMGLGFDIPMRCVEC
jgi:hypothetical protein